MRQNDHQKIFTACILVLDKSTYVYGGGSPFITPDVKDADCLSTKSK